LDDLASEFDGFVARHFFPGAEWQIEEEPSTCEAKMAVSRHATTGNLMANMKILPVVISS